MSLSEKRHLINKNLGDFVGKVSQAFMDLSTSLKTSGAGSDDLKKVDKLFRMILDFNRSLTNEIDSLLDNYDLLSSKIEKLNEEKNRLERLYASGILFQSETEMISLMEKAIDTVVKELSADEGFIVLLDKEKEVERIVAKNMNPDENVTAKDMSMSIIQNTIKSIEPVQLNDLKSEVEFSSKNSIISLGLTAAMCAPLVTGQKVLGAVYIDRRSKEKPFNETDLTFLIAFAKQIVKGMEISHEIETLEEKLAEKPSYDLKVLREQFRSSDMIGTGRKIYNVLQLASKVSNTDASVLILGENGTGKELLSKAVHENSNRSNKPFIAVNCGAIPADLIESELFGYESGAFTGAVKSKPGRLEIADGGTIFLDEIGELNINLQAKLLRVIQTKEIERLGSISTKKIDVRFIAATNKDISKMISEKSFREDLYYRLKVIEIQIPSLRERREDIEELVNHFLNKYSRDEPYTITDNALSILESYNWPGNIRELENVIQRCVILAKSKQIDIDDLPPEIINDNEELIPGDFTKSLNEAESEFRRMYLLKILRKTNSKAEAARVLGINRSYLHKLLAQLEINI